MPETSSSFEPMVRTIGRIGLGSVRFTQATAAHDLLVIDAFLAGGGALLDTAAMYQGGESVRVIGRWLRERQRRDDLVLLAKGGYPDKAGNNRISPEALRADLDASLAGLGAEAVDIFMPHVDDPAVPVDEIADCLDEFVRAGMTRTIGASNWTPARIEAFNSYATANHRTRFSSISVQWSLAARVTPYLPGNIGVDPKTRAWYRSSGLPIFAWSSLALGFFFDPIAEPSRESSASYDSLENRERRRRAWIIGRRTGRSAAQVALAWLVTQPERPVALVGAASVEHVRDMLASVSLSLAPDELDWLDLVGPDSRGSR